MIKFNKILFAFTLYAASLIAQVEELTLEKYNQKINDKKPLIVKYGTSWCPPCQTLKPIFEEIAQDLKDEYNFMQADIEQVKDLAQSHQVNLVPTIVVIKDSQVLGKIEGVLQAKELKDKIKDVLNPKPLKSLSKEELSQKATQALTSCNLAEFKKITEAGFDINQTIVFHNAPITPLYLTSVMLPVHQEKALELFTFLIENGANLTFSIQGQTMEMQTFLDQIIESCKKQIECYTKGRDILLKHKNIKK